jgi:hypothetical protein
LRYLFVDHAVPAMWRSLAAARACSGLPISTNPRERRRLCTLVLP